MKDITKISRSQRKFSDKMTAVDRVLGIMDVNCSYCISPVIHWIIDVLAKRTDAERRTHFFLWAMVQTCMKIETVSNMSDFYSISKPVIAQKDLYPSEGLYYPPISRWQGNYQDLPACIVQDENINIISWQIPLPLVNWSMCPWLNSATVKVGQVYPPLASSSFN